MRRAVSALAGTLAVLSPAAVPARSSGPLSPSVLDRMKAIAAGQGYDLSRLYMVPQRPD